MGRWGKAMTKFSFISVISIFVFWSSIAGAIPILNTVDTLADGSSYGKYTNSGSLWFIESGNNSGNPAFIESLESRVEEYMGLDTAASEDFELYSTNVSWTFEDYGRTGTWGTTSADLISLYIVKAGSAFATYIVNPSANTGSWSTYDLWNWGANSGADLAISHFTGYNSSDIPAPVPEPATIMLLGTGILALVAVGKKKTLKK